MIVALSSGAAVTQFGLWTAVLYSQSESHSDLLGYELHISALRCRQPIYKNHMDKQFAFWLASQSIEKFSFVHLNVKLNNGYDPRYRRGAKNMKLLDLLECYHKEMLPLWQCRIDGLDHLSANSGNMQSSGEH